MIEPDGLILQAMHERLLKIRATEETLARRYREGEMRTPVHFGTGQEAVAVGVCQALRSDDVVFSHHRCHNHFLAKGGGTYELAAELYGRVDGCSKGRGGSVHLTASECGFIASSAILGEMTAVAVGAALAFKMDNNDRVAVAFFGDGAMEEGAVYEAFNYASLKKLPVLFVCENNLYATESPIPSRQPVGTDLCERAESFKIPASRIDGNDVLGVYTTALVCIDEMRSGGGPRFMECMTYRWLEHVGPMSDQEQNRTYRSIEEVEDWMARCPIKRSGQRIVQLGIATAADLETWRQASEDEAGLAIERARQAPWPDVSTLSSHV